MSGLARGLMLIAACAGRLLHRHHAVNNARPLPGRGVLMLAALLAFAVAGSSAAQADADLAISNLVNNPSPNVGDSVTFTIIVTNAGPDDATATSVSVPLPAGLSFQSASWGTGTFDFTTGLWQLGPLLNGGTQVLRLTAQVSSASIATTSAVVTETGQLDPNPANNFSSVTVTPQQADLSITNVVSNATPTVGSTITYTLTLTNNGPNSATGVAVTDLLPTGLLFTNAIAGGGTYNPVTGVWSISSVAVSAVQTLQLVAQVTSPTLLANTATISHSDQFDPNTANNAATANAAPAATPPSISQAFGTSTIPLNGTTSLTFTITNPNTGLALTGVGFSDTLPAGLVVATPNGLTGSCGAGTVSAVAGGGSISLAGGSIPANSTCSVSVNVMGAVAGVKNNTTSAVTSTEGGNGNTSTASLTVSPAQVPTLSQAFGAPSILLNTTTSLTFTIVNPNTAAALTGVAFTDALPAGLVVATPSGVTGACGTGTISAASGGSSISLSGGSVPASGTCSVSVNVTGTTAGAKTNTTSAVTSTEGGNGNTSTASLTVSPALVPTLSQAFGAPSIVVNTATSLTFTIVNPNTATPLTGVAFTDALPAGLVLATPSGVTGACGTGAISAAAGGSSISLSGGSVPASGTCSFSVNVMGSTAGVKTNTTSALVTNEAGTGGTSTASLTVSPPQGPTLSQAFGAPSILLNTTTSLTFTIVNPNTATPLTGIAFTDALPAGLVVATPNGVTGACGTGAISAAAGGSSISLSGGSVPASGSCSFSVNVTGTTAGAKTNTTSALVTNETGSGGTASATLAVTPAASTATTLASSANPSSVGQAVTFTAGVSSGAGTPTGTVTFKDGSAVLGTAALSAGVATFTAASLAQGTHTITASYGGGTSFMASASAALMQVVNIPADSLKLRAMQLLAAPVAAQVSGQAISSAVGSAVSEGFSDGSGAFMTPSAGGIRFNFAADPDEKPANAGVGDTKVGSGDPFNSASGAIASATRREPGQAPARIDDSFGALGYAGPTKAPPSRRVEPKDWLGWAEVRGAILDRWSTSTLGAPATAPMLYGNQINALAGLTRKLLPNFLVGVVGGYETFDYRSDALQGRLKGDGWTIGSYLGWMITANMRFDAAVAYSGIGYDGSAGTASGTFGGHRLLVSGGLTGTYRTYGLEIEPSARVYALWEREDAYTDTLGTAQAERTFSTGRASGGLKVAYPIAWSPTSEIAPYVGVYGDYYFNTDDGTAVAAAVAALPAAVVLDGWSARAVGGIGARFGNGAQVSVGGERSGFGSGFALWTYRARASVPFAAQ